MSAPDWTEGLGLPAEVLDLVEHSPLEDMVIHALQHYLPAIPALSLIPEDPPPLFILVRKDHSPGLGIGYNRFVGYGRARVDVFATDPDGDEKGAVVSDAIRVALRSAWLDNHHVPGRGWISQVELLSEGSRKTDWATAAGPVQYADLPTGYWRYESKFDVFYRRELPRPMHVLVGAEPAED